MITSSGSAAWMPAVVTAPRMAAVPSCTAVRGESTPRNAPMGVRWAETMTTSVLDMVNLPLQCRFFAGQPRTAAPARRLARREKLRITCARAQACFEDRHKGLGNLRAAQGLVLAVPVRDPVERAGEGEGGHLRVAGVDGTVLHPLADQAPDAMVDF